MTEQEPLTLEFSREGHVAHLQLNRPQKSNALNRALLEGLRSAIEEIESRDGVRCATVRGAGGTFSAGADLGALEGSIDDGNREAVNEYIDLIHDTLDRLADLSVPTVAVVEGFALAGGLEVLLACDLAIASEDAAIGDQHANYGLIAGGGGTQRLPRTVGVRRAKELMFTGERLSGDQAVEWELVNRTAPAEDLDDAVTELVDSLAEKSPVAAAKTKYLIDAGLETDVESGLAIERETSKTYLFSDTVEEGLSAFAEGRDPSF